MSKNTSRFLLVNLTTLSLLIALMLPTPLASKLIKERILEEEPEKRKSITFASNMNKLKSAVNKVGKVNKDDVIQTRKEKSSDDDSEESSESAEHGQVGGSSIYSSNVEEVMAGIRKEYINSNSIDVDNFLVELFRTGKGLYINYSQLPEEERLRAMYFSIMNFNKNIWNISYLKRKIYVVQCPSDPQFKRPRAQLSTLTISTLKRMEEILELFSTFYLETIDTLPEILYSQNKMGASQKVLAGEEVIKKMRRKLKDANSLFTVLDEKYGALFVEISKVQCDIKDFMNFYNLLPRFLYVHKNLKHVFVENTDPYIKYVVKQLKNLSYRWKHQVNSLLKSIQFINFFVVFTKMVFEMVQLNKDATEILNPVRVFLNLYNMNNYTFAHINNIRREFLEDFEELKDIFRLIENQYGLNSMPFPVYEDYPELFNSEGVWLGWVWLAFFAWLFNKD